MGLSTRSKKKQTYFHIGSYVNSWMFSCNPKSSRNGLIKRKKKSDLNLAGSNVAAYF